MNLNLRLLNLFIGMCKGDRGLPDGLRRLGYRERAVELQFQNANREAVVPELIIASRQIHHALLMEWKQGANVDADQLRRYSGITREDLTQRAMLFAEESANHDITVVGLEDHRARIVQGVREGGFNFPVLVVTAGGLEIAHNRFSIADTDALFRQGLQIDWAKAPTSYFPIDADSELWEYAEQVMRELVLRMEKGSTRILTSEIAQAVIPLWQTASVGFRRRVEAKITQVLDQAGRRHFSAYIKRNRGAERITHSPTWDVTDNPLVDKKDKRLKVWRELSKLQQRVISHFQDPEQQPDLPLGEDE